MASLGRRIARALAGAVVDAARRAGQQERGRSGGERPSPRPAREPVTSPYAGDYDGVPDLTYAPVTDDLPDPGEVVWAWVPYEEDHARGKVFSIPSAQYKALTAMARVVPSGVLHRFQTIGRK